MILPLPWTGPSRRCRLQLTTKTRFDEFLPPGQGDGAERLRLVGLAVAQERPDLALRRVRDAAVGQVAHEPGLVDGHDRPEAHRDRRELPEVRHQPGVGVGGQAARLRDLLAEALELFLRDPALQVGARVDARRGVALDVDEVTAVLVRRRVPEVVEADLVEERRRLEAGDVPAQLRGLLVGAQDHRDRVPADQRADAPLHRRVARQRRLVFAVDRVHVRRRPHVLDRRAAQPGPLDHPLDQIMGAPRAVVLDDGIEGLEPLLGLDCVDIHPGASLSSAARIRLTGLRIAGSD